MVMRIGDRLVAGMSCQGSRWLYEESPVKYIKTGDIHVNIQHLSVTATTITRNITPFSHNAGAFDVSGIRAVAACKPLRLQRGRR
jgi:hypothetical protein